MFASLEPKKIITDSIFVFFSKSRSLPPQFPLSGDEALRHTQPLTKQHIQAPIQPFTNQLPTKQHIQAPIQSPPYPTSVPPLGGVGYYILNNPRHQSLYCFNIIQFFIFYPQNDKSMIITSCVSLSVIVRCILMISPIYLNNHL
jgi:hypothetical protein